MTTSIVLGQVFRQKEASFADVLNELRIGKVSQQSIDFLRE